MRTVVKASFFCSAVAASRFEPMHDAARCRARSNLYTVAVQNSSTNIPLAADKAQKDGTILAKRHFKPSHTSVRPPGSSGLIKP